MNREAWDRYQRARRGEGPRDDSSAILCPHYENCDGQCPKHKVENRIRFNNIITANGYPHPGPAYAFPEAP
jgi:hypothetical protein